MSKNFTAAIDFGSAKIAIAVGRHTENGVKIICYHDATSSGIKNGEIINEFKVEQTVRELVGEVEQDINDTIDEVIAGVGVKFIHSSFSSYTKQRAIPSNYITESDINEITRERFSTRNAGGEIVYEVSPLKYSIDEYNGLDKSEVQGMTGKTIETTCLLAFASESPLKKLRAILDNCGISLRKAILNPVASSRAVLTEQEMENGVALVDIGKGTTEIAVIKENIIRNIASIPFGGESITNDIKTLTGTTAKWAEEAKVRNGCCCEEFIQENTKLILKGKENVVEGEIDLNLMTRVIEARMIEILEAVKYVIDQSKYATDLSSGVVITGGGCYLENLKQLAGAILERKIRLAAPRNSITGDSVDACFDAYASTVVGLVLEGASPTLSNAITHNQTNPVKKPLDASKQKGGGGFIGGIFGSGPKGEEEKALLEELAKKRKEEERIRKEEAKRKKEEEKRRKEEEKARRIAQKQAAEQERKNQPSLFESLFSANNNDNA